MPNGQDDHKLQFNTIANHIAAITEIDDPVPEFIIHIFHRAPHCWLLLQHPYPLPYCPYSTLCGVEIFGRKEAVNALHILQRLGRPDQT